MVVPACVGGRSRKKIARSWTPWDATCHSKEPGRECRERSGGGGRWKGHRYQEGGDVQWPRIGPSLK